MEEKFELRLSLLVCSLLAGAYLVYGFVANPSGGHPFGHWLGILGTLLMLATETLYSIRKRTMWFRRFGPVRWWLAAHIFTGIVGPAMVLVHSAFEFRGLAGLSLGLTVLVVASGFVGRYLYTAVPRSLSGAEATALDLQAESLQLQNALAELAGQRSAAVQALVEADAQRRRVARGALWLVILRGWDDLRYRTRLHAQIRRLERIGQRKLADVEKLLVQRRNLERQMRMLEATRRLLSVWHIAHVPLGVTLFGSAAIHVIATLYFRAGLWQ